MKLVYAKLDPGNFGDEINPYLWPRLFPDAFATRGDADFLGIGTILSSDLNRSPRCKVVFGTGAGYWRAPVIDGKWTIYFVRGPLTATMLKLPAERAIADGAYCLAFLDEPTAAESIPVVFMPHHKSEGEVDWRGLCAELGWRYASPAAAVGEGLRLLRSARLVITEAMHGAIVADLYRVPWVPIRYGFRSLDFKWEDWCASMSVAYRPIDLPLLLDADLGSRETLERLAKRAIGSVGLGKPAWRSTPVFLSGQREREKALGILSSIPSGSASVLSSDAALERVKDRLWVQMERFRAACH